MSVNRISLGILLTARASLIWKLQPHTRNCFLRFLHGATSTISMNRIPQITNSYRKLSAQAEVLETDELYSQVQLLIKGQDKELIGSYVTFVKMTCHHLEVEYDEPVSLPWTRRMITLLKSRHVHKRAKVQYEVRTHTVRMNINNITGSSASVFLEYIQRNIPEAVAMQVNKTQLLPLPEQISNSMSANPIS